ncbi:MAG: thiosulfate oxidation carrier complex protein SoxZ [Halieaceae bacterium]|nr:thiosulfate oxidation carrier complex protein SoxZ [Halieaceae bacterium]
MADHARSEEIANYKPRTRVRLRLKEADNAADNVLSVMTMVVHPMTPGIERDAEDNPVIKDGKVSILEHKTHHLVGWECKVNGEVVLAADLSGSVSKDPIINFAVKGVEAGDTFALSWTDNQGFSDTEEQVVKGRKKK